MYKKKYYYFRAQKEKSTLNDNEKYTHMPQVMIHLI